MIDDLKSKQEYKRDIKPSGKMENDSCREAIWENYPLCDIHIAWEYSADGEKVDYYAYLQAGEDGSVSPDKAVIQWETSWIN